MTLRQALQSVNLANVYKFINAKDQGNAAACDRPSLETTKKAYAHVVEELLSKPKVKPYIMSWFVTESIDHFSKEKYADVCFLNHKYVAPKKGLKPWGGTKGKKVPKGHYDCNAEKHNKTYAAGFVPWSKVIDTPIIVDADFTMEKAVAELLWELTFYGWTEKLVDKQVKVIEGRIKEAVDEVKKGKCVTLPAKKKGGFKVVIPDSVSKQIIDIANKKKS